MSKTKLSGQNQQGNLPNNTLLVWGKFIPGAGRRTRSEAGCGAGKENGRLIS